MNKPSWQRDPKCSFRTGNDVAAVAWNVAIYDTYGYRGWDMVGGTSIGSPLLAGVYGLAGNASRIRAARRSGALKTNGQRRNCTRSASARMIELPAQRGAAPISARPERVSSRPTPAPAGWGTPNGIGAF